MFRSVKPQQRVESEAKEGVAMPDKRYRLSLRELELVLAGLLILIDKAEDPGFGDAAFALAKRLTQSRPGRPGGLFSGESSRLWRRAVRRSSTKRW